MNQFLLHCTKYATIRDFTDLRFCTYTGEYGSVKTRILAYFMECYNESFRPKLNFHSENFIVLDIHFKKLPFCAYVYILDCSGNLFVFDAKNYPN